MTESARTQWWDDVIRADTVRLNDHVHLLWGDRVRVLQKDDATGKARIFGRGSTGWVAQEVLGGAPLLEIYFIDVGQGDGVLVVTPEGHHLMIDGGHQRNRQQTGKSAADFVDWKFHKEYLSVDERRNPDKNAIRLDAMLASHADADHYGGLRDLIDRKLESDANELDTDDVTVEAFYHPGLCPQRAGTDGLGDKVNGFFVSLLDDRRSLEAGLADNPVGAPEIRGFWRDFLTAVKDQRRKNGAPTPVVRISQKTAFLPGFSEQDDTSVTIRVLAPIENDINGVPALRDLGNEAVNKNGHSIALRLDYGQRKIMLTGDLNEQSERDIMAHYGDDFAAVWSVDVAKACHHGSHHVDYDFLRGLSALSTIFSSGDANTYDHPRAWVLGAAALSGRVIEDDTKARLKAPLIYSTEIARSISLKSVDQLREYHQPQRYGRQSAAPSQTISGTVTKSKWRAVLDRRSAEAKDIPPLSNTKVLRDIIYGLVNVRTDGKRLLFAVRNEGNHAWAYETMEPGEIAGAYRLKPDI